MHHNDAVKRRFGATAYAHFLRQERIRRKELFLEEQELRNADRISAAKFPCSKAPSPTLLSGIKEMHDAKFSSYEQRAL